MKSPAEVVMEVFGGARAVGRALGIQHTSVLLWLDGGPRSEAGLVPSHHHKALLTIAREQGLALSESDLIWGRKAAA